MKRIAIYCVSYNSDKERDHYLSSIQQAADKAADRVSVDVFVANNTQENNPGYFGSVKQLMQDVDQTAYDYSIISNVDLTMEEDFLKRIILLISFALRINLVLNSLETRAVTRLES